MNDEVEFIETFVQRFSNNTDIFLVQIGANDGVMADPVHKLIKGDNRISACLIEPQKKELEKLKQNYELCKNKLMFLNVAITSENGNVKLYKNIDPLGSSGHSSLLLRQNEFAAHFSEDAYELVEGINFSTLMKKIPQTINALVIDTEGYDIEIINQVIKNKIYPDIIFFERPYPHAGNDRLNNVETGNEVLRNMVNTLDELDYDVKVLSGNVLCVKK
jgi:FkbM family methyltransferase